MTDIWDLPGPHVIDITVSARDIDGLGHTNNTCYISWCERCAWDHSEQLGLSIAHYRQLDRGMAIQHAEYDYFRPSFESDGLRVATWLVYCDHRLRLRRRFQIIERKTGHTVMRGLWTLVSMQLSTGKAVRLPARFVEVYSSAVVDDPLTLSPGGV